jgi:hypothetical protein
MVSFRIALGGWFLCALLMGASSAHAIYGTPLDDLTVCGNPEVADTMSDPDVFTDESSVKDCLAWCKKAIASCHRQVGRIYACKQTLAQDNNKFLGRACTHQEGDARKACFAGLKDDLKTLKGDLKGGHALDDQGCEDWGAQCVTACNESSF